MIYNVISSSIQTYQGGLQYAPWRALITAITPNPTVVDTPYRPVVWDSGTPAAVIIQKTGDNEESFIFDAIFRFEHMNGRRITEHPVQSGANISDHSFQLPAVLTMEIGMSDVMDNYIADSWGGAETYPTKSVRAYEKIIEWQESGDPLTIQTRLMVYENMVVETVSAQDDFKTKYALKCMVNFKQIITAEVVTKPPASTIPQVSTVTNTGTKTPVEPRASVLGSGEAALGNWWGK